LSKDMADQRKSFRSRRLALGGRILPFALILGASLVFHAGAPALAETEGLKNGAASLAAGKYDAAVRQLSTAINSDDASPSEGARALYLRGLAYRKMGEPARAVADLGAAIWLGLPEADKIKALVNRGLAYQAAGLGKEGEAELAAARKLGGSRAVDDLVAEGGGVAEGAAAIAAFATEVRPEEQSASSPSARARGEAMPSFSTTVTGGDAPVPQAAPKAEAAPTRTANASPNAWTASVADEAQPASSGGGNRLTRWFGSLSDSSASQTAAPAPAPAPTAQPAPKASTSAAGSSWSTTTETVDAPAPANGSESKSRWTRLFNRTAEANPEAPATPAAQAAAGTYRLQLATSRSEDEAKALWKKVSQTQNMAGIQPAIERVEIGDFGTFYALRIGPFPDKAESLKVCNALKRSGIDCSPAEQ
jgi:tetratricopeptide (TPR) repeat protein